MGATTTIINPTTAAVATVQWIDARTYDRVVIAAPGLATTEEVDLVLGGGAVPAAFTMPDGTTPGKLTAANASLELPGAMYGITKDATAASVGVDATLIGCG